MHKILIVDDDRDLLEGQKMYLESKGYTIETAINMEEGLKKLRDFKPDLIIVDLMMEHYDTGFVFCKKIKDNPELSNVPIFIQTAASKEVGYKFDITDSKNREWIKADEILTKPIPLEYLEGKIKQYLEKK